MQRLPVRILVIDFTTVVLLAVAAGLAAGVALAGVTLLFASQGSTVSHSVPAQVQPNHPAQPMLEVTPHPQQEREPSQFSAPVMRRMA